MDFLWMSLLSQTGVHLGINYIFQAIYNKKQLNVIYTETQQAFDEINHKTLLDKLAQFRFTKTATIL